MVIKKVFEDFYRENFLMIRDSFYRNQYFSFGLILFQTIQLQGIFLSENNFEPQKHEKKRGIMDAIIWILKSSKQTFDQNIRIYPLFQTETNLSQIYFIDVCFLIIVIVISLLNLIVVFRKNSQQKQTNQKINGLFSLKFSDFPIQLQTKQYFHVNFIKFITNALSFFLQTYKYVLHWMTIYCSLNIFNNYIADDQQANQNWIYTQGMIASIFVFLFFLILDIFMMFHCFDYKFKNKDCLGRKVTGFKLLQNIYIYACILIIIFTKQKYPNLQLLLGLFCNLFFLLLSTLQILFRRQQINTFQSFVLGQFIFIYIGQICYINNLFSIDFLNLLVFISSPIIIAVQIIIRREQFKYHFAVSLKDPRNLEEKLRIMYDLIKMTYYKDWRTFKKPIIRTYISLQLHNVAANHLRNCSGYLVEDGQPLQYNLSRQCFCRQYFQYSEQKSLTFWKRDLDHDTEKKYFAFKSEKQFKQFLFDLIRYYFERFLQNKSFTDNNEQFSYIYFLFQVQKKPTKAFYEAMNLKFKVKKLNQKRTMIIEQLIQDAKHNFNQMIEKKDLKNQKYNFKQVFDFDSNLDTSKQNFQIILSNYKKWFYQLLNQQLQLQSIIKKGTELQLQIQVLEKQLFQLYQLNPVSTELDTIIYLFYKYLNFNIKRPKTTKRNSTYANQFVQSINQQVFQRDSCIIYISLMNQRGSIQNYTKSFKSLILGTDQDIKYQNIKHFMPDSIAQYHDMYLDNFIEFGRMNIVMAEQRFLILKNKESFIIPVYAKVRLENYSNSDFGSSALITQINQQNYYIVISKFGILEEISQNFYEDIIKKTFNCPPNQLKNLNFLRIMPCLLRDLQKLEETYKNNTEIDFEFQQQNKDKVNYDILKEGHILIPRQFNLNEYIQLLRTSMTGDIQTYFLLNNRKVIFTIRTFNIILSFILMKTINSLHIILDIQNLKMVKSEQQQKVLKVIQNLCNFEGQHINIQQQTPKINYMHQDSEYKENLYKDNFDLFRKSQSSEYLERKYQDVESNLLLEDDVMITQKQRNIEEYNPFSKREQISLTLDSKSKENQQLLQMEFDNSKQYQRQNSFQLISKNQIEDMDLSNKNSKDSIDSSSDHKSNNKITIHQNDGGSSIGSSQQQSDYLSKRRMIKDVLYSDHQFQNNTTKKGMLIFGLLLLIILYVLNLVFIIISKEKFLLIETNKHVSKNIECSFNLFILSNQYQQILRQNQTTLPWYDQIQNVSINYYKQYIQVILNEQNTIIEQSSFNQQQNIIFTQNNQTLLLDQLFIFKLVGQQMIDYIKNNEVDDNNSIQFIIDNYLVIITDMLSELNSSITTNINEQIDFIQTQHQLSIILSEVTLSLLVIILLPVFLVINKQKNTILQFFTTFPQSELQQQFDVYQILLEKLEETKFAQQETNQYDIESVHIKKFAKTIRGIKDSNHKKQQHGKLKTIIGSNATPLIIFSILLVLLLFSIVSAYFITSYLIQFQFLNEYQNYFQQNTIYSTLQNEILKENSIENIIINSLISQNTLEVNDTSILQLIQYQQENQNQALIYYSQELTGKLNNDDSQLFEILSNNFCAVFDSLLISHLSNQQYLDYFSYEICESFGNQQSGVSVTLANFITQMNQFYETLSIFECNINILNPQNLDKEVILLSNKELQEIFIYLTFVLQVISDYEDYQLRDLIDSHFVSQIVIFAIGATFVCVFTFITEKCFKNLISNQINQSKLLLTLIPFEVLQTNAYVMTYVLQESKKIYL
ncbi:unnamed protein product (macronuclear) [Paramecium tetraurelia]|uniref:Transmembrane protein n=1 Tax=Paramecium tetraurelia TaxID=5888 RepID=A0EFQ1_PARTE|nr:uncharacterized protein GSPATT00026465001 [Paramecium tetraurelia]CAK94142.1 unnamed protein product [Paramecium tetraurelia]|eukprot:XP_001461515.1 hypothetical protein (macronuclear) [Paramecium tetraurelia strain d4-2]